MVGVVAGPRLDLGEIAVKVEGAEVVLEEVAEAEDKVIVTGKMRKIREMIDLT